MVLSLIYSDASGRVVHPRYWTWVTGPWTPSGTLLCSSLVLLRHLTLWRKAAVSHAVRVGLVLAARYGVESMEKLQLPLGVQNLCEIRRDGHYYVDKTDYVCQLARHSKYSFLSRPRRFGKSLLVDTIKEAFEGNKELFEGLAIYDRWDWSIRHPVIRLDYAGGNFLNPDTVTTVTNFQLDRIERMAGVKTSQTDVSTRFFELIDCLYESTGMPVVVLVDEYDKPILDALENTEVALSNRNVMRSIFGTLKTADALVRYGFFTGVSKFSKVSLFSGLNQLVDITLLPQYSAVCGYTDQDLDAVFGPELEGLDRAAVREWYNGYSWLGEERVYCPHDLLLLFDTREFKAWWNESGSPAFLADLLRKKRMYSTKIGKKFYSENMLSRFDFDEQVPEALLFQTGYLTIAETKKKAYDMRYRLDYPNLEVRRSLSSLLESTYLHDWDATKQDEEKQNLEDYLEDCDVQMLEEHFKSLFSSIPHQWYDTSKVKDYEAHCASVFLSHLHGANLEVRAEESTSLGRIDPVAILENRVYIFEFKIAERSESGNGMEQMRNRGCADKYRSKGLPIHLVSVEYSSEKRNIVKFCLEDA